MTDPLVATGAVVCVLLFALTVLAVVAGRRARRRRWERTRQWAREHGWQATQQPNVDWWRRLPGANPRGVTLLLAGVVRGRPVHVAQYEITDTTVTTNADGSTATGSNTRQYTVVVAALRTVLPDIAVEPRGALSRLKNRAAGPGTAGTGDAQFDHEFRIRTSAPQAVARWCTPQVRAAHASGHVLVPWTAQGRELLHFARGPVDLTTVIPYAESLVWLADSLDPAR
jgi:hypothetical protein